MTPGFEATSWMRRRNKTTREGGIGRMFFLNVFHNQNCIGQMKASAEQEEMTQINIFCALKILELPSEALLQLTDAISIKLFQFLPFFFSCNHNIYNAQNILVNCRKKLRRNWFVVATKDAQVWSTLQFLLIWNFPKFDRRKIHKISLKSSHINGVVACSHQVFSMPHTSRTNTN